MGGSDERRVCVGALGAPSGLGEPPLHRFRSHDLTARCVQLSVGFEVGSHGLWMDCDGPRHIASSLVCHYAIVRLYDAVCVT